MKLMKQVEKQLKVKIKEYTEIISILNNDLKDFKRALKNTEKLNKVKKVKKVK